MHLRSHAPDPRTCRSSMLLDARQKAGTKAPKNWRKAGRSPPSPSASSRRCSRICSTGAGAGGGGAGTTAWWAAPVHVRTALPTVKQHMHCASHCQTPLTLQVNPTVPSPPPPHPLQLVGAVGREGHLLGRQLSRSAVQVAPAGPGRRAHQQQRHLRPRVLPCPHQPRQQLATCQAVRIVQHQPGAAAAPPRHIWCRTGSRARHDT